MKFAILFVSIFSFGIADCLWVTVNKHASVVFNMLSRSFITTILFLFLSVTTFLLGVNDYIPLSFHSGVIAIAICMLCYGGQFCYVRSLKYATVSTSITIISVITAILSLVISVFFYKEHCDTRTIICILITMAGVYVTFHGGNSKRGHTSKLGLLYICLSSLCWGVGYSFIKTPVKQLGFINFSLLLESVVLFSNIILFIYFRKEIHYAKGLFSKPGKPLLLLGVLIFFGTICNSISYKFFPVYTLNLAGKVGILVPILYSVFVLREYITRGQVIGIIITLFGVICISI